MPALLSVLSYYSLMTGVLSPRAICSKAKELGYDAVAITDTDNLYALPAFIDSCKEQGMRAIIAAKITADQGSLLLYADGEKGYQNLCRVISEIHCSKTFNLVTSMKADPSGLYAVSQNQRVLMSLRTILPVYYHMVKPRIVPSWVKKSGIEALVIPQTIFTSSDQYQVHRMLNAIRNNTTLSRVNEKELYSADALIKPWDEIKDRFEVFEKELALTEDFAEKIISRKEFGHCIMPEFKSGSSASQLLRSKAFEGAKRRYGEISEKVEKRLLYELSLIESKNFCGYFLIVDDIVKQSPRTCGRGSGAASIVAYCLGITNVDPIRYNLMFERFLNPGRTDPPDIDIDFAWDERDAVIQYVFDKYGTEHTAMVATHQTCGMRMAIREVARVFGCTEQEISEVTKKIPWFTEIPEGDGGLETALQLWPETSDVRLDSPWPEILCEAQKIVGMPRGIGTHCGGVVITPGPVNRHAPVQYSASGVPIIQWEKDGAEAMGLVKIDLLGNRSLAVIRDAIINVKKENREFDESRWDPQSDPATIALFARGESIGVFYVESPAMRLLQKKSAKGDFEYLVIHSSIIRPAANSYIQQYLKRLHGAPYKMLHPLLNGVLDETFGIMVYQEDVARVAMALAGFDSQDADTLRKIMSKKIHNKRFEDYRVKFFSGAEAKGVNVSVINAVWNMMLSFCGYSFCKPHSASYVQVSFQSAYLKAHFPAAFMAAVLSNYGGYYSTQAYISEAMRLGVKIIPPDINLSSVNFQSRNNSIIVGFCQIKSLTFAAQRTIVQERNAGGNYHSFEDFYRRTKLDESDMERLTLAGAFDTICKPMNRAQQFWLMRTCYKGAKARTTAPRLKPLSHRQFLAYQYKVLGFLTPDHPVSYVKTSGREKFIKIRQIERLRGTRVRFLGWCITSKTVSTKVGDSMVFVSFEDETGICESVLFPQVYKRCAYLLSFQTALVVSGKVTEEFGVKVVDVERIERP
ncbi:DNA polymerase III subunit alpha [Chitinispirillales bacterium ANBcel5]|uniref:DNA polymerase III subunit alpha n=1 Tax=Cellulosispirillum alkaliphilum TaxID=3039283 RepID=UPI002A4FA732|nr:DNA polymerase III subunit alpha [Chitinispirillales bacterium ANBcel5]